MGDSLIWKKNLRLKLQIYKKKNLLFSEIKEVNLWEKQPSILSLWSHMPSRPYIDFATFITISPDYYFLYFCDFNLRECQFLSS